MKEEKQTINGFETTVLVGDDTNVDNESEGRVGPETSQVMGGLNDPNSNLNALKGDDDADTKSKSVDTKARKSTENKSA